MAYFVNLTNFLVTKRISALALQVLGNAKGAIVMVVSVVIMVGYSFTVFGVVLYSEVKWG
jgi:hypothetical protein